MTRTMADETTETFAQALKRLRLEAGMTQAELAAACGLVPAQISNFERGVSEPSFGLLLVLASGLGCSLAVFDAVVSWQYKEPSPGGNARVPKQGRPQKDIDAAGQARFGARLRELRDAAGFSRRELGLRIGMRSERAIHSLELGLTSPSWDMVERLCVALGVSAEAFREPEPGRE